MLPTIFTFPLAKSLVLTCHLIWAIMPSSDRGMFPWRRSFLSLQKWYTVAPKQSLQITEENKLFPLTSAWNHFTDWQPKNRAWEHAKLKLHLKNMCSLFSMWPWQNKQSLEQLKPHIISFSLVVRASPNANQRMKECLGIAKGNQTMPCQSTVGNSPLTFPKFQSKKKYHFWNSI